MSNVTKSLTAAADVVAAVSLLASLFKDIGQIVELFQEEDLTEEQVKEILERNREAITSRIENAAPQ